MQDTGGTPTWPLVQALERGRAPLEALCALMWAVRSERRLRHLIGTAAAAATAAAWALRHAGALGQLDRLDLGEGALPHLVAELEDGFRIFREWSQVWAQVEEAAGQALGPLAAAARAMAAEAFSAWQEASLAGANLAGAGAWEQWAGRLGLLLEEGEP